MKNILKILLCLIIAAGASQAAATENGGDKCQRHNKETRHHDKKRHINVMHKEDFELLCSIVEESDFDSNKIIIIRAGSIGNHFSCKQAAELLSLLSFDSSKLEALEYIAQRIIVKKDIKELIEEFDFSSSKDKALKILSQREN